MFLKSKLFPPLRNEFLVILSHSLRNHVPHYSNSNIVIAIVFYFFGIKHDPVSKQTDRPTTLFTHPHTHMHAQALTAHAFIFCTSFHLTQQFLRE